MFNIYDQANKVTYPDYKSGYWQRQVTPAELSARDIYTYFTTNFGTELDSINQWGAGDRVGGLFLFGDTLYLARVHDGGKDSRGRPQRWTLLVWREDNVSGDTPRTLDLTRWLADPQWPADSTPVPLPFPVPAVPYSAPFIAAKPVPDSTLPIGGRMDESSRSLADAQALWAAWSSAPVPRRAENGFMIFAAVGGAFKSHQELSLGESETHKAEVAEEKRRREEEERQRREEEKRLRREREEAERLRLLEVEERRWQENALYLFNKAEGRRRFWKRVFLGIKIILAILFFLFVGWFGFIAWNYQEKHPEVWNFVKKLPFISETTPASPKQVEPSAPPNDEHVPSSQSVPNKK